MIFDLNTLATGAASAVSDSSEAQLLYSAHWCWWAGLFLALGVNLTRLVLKWLFKTCL